MDQHHHEQHQQEQQEDDERILRSFQTQGFLKLPHLLSHDTCHHLREFILDDLEAALLLHEQQEQQQQDDDDREEVETETRFSNIHERSHRWDLKLKASPLVVKTAMREILEHNQFLQGVLAPLCCQYNQDDNNDDISDVVLAELGALISEPGAKGQVWHADTAHTGATNPDCICCFVTLQETPPSLGPTQLIPETHTQEFHQCAFASFPPKGLMPPNITPKTMQCGYSHTGEAVLMDCRLYHRGAANTYSHQQQQPDHESTTTTANTTDVDNDGKRVVFYFTVRSRNISKPGGFLFTILKEVEGMPLIDFLWEEEEKEEDHG